MKTVFLRFQEWKFRRDSRRIARLLRRISLVMNKRGWPRWKKKQFWNDLIKHDAVREDLFSHIEKDFK